MLAQIEQCLHDALQVLKVEGVIPQDISPLIRVQRTPDAVFGDLTTNLALLLSEACDVAARDIAQRLVDAILRQPSALEVDIAGPGFINFYLDQELRCAIVAQILEQGEQFGSSKFGAGKSVQAGFFAATSAAPLHVGQGRVVALGASIGNMLEAVGFKVSRNYFASEADSTENLIDDDLARLGTLYYHYSSALCIAERATAIIRQLEQTGHTFVRDGATWLDSSNHSGDNEPVLIYANGEATELAIYSTYIHEMLCRGFDTVIDLVNADQHGYVAPAQALCSALGSVPGSVPDTECKKLQALRVQPVTVCRSLEPAPQSSRLVSQVELFKLYEAVGKDAARFFYVTRSYSRHLEFDPDLATNWSCDNPVYSVQFAYARICSLKRQLRQCGTGFDPVSGLAAMSRLTATTETELMMRLAIYPEIVQRAALAYEPYQLTRYLRDLANGLHTYYSSKKVLVDDHSLRQARLCLLLAVQQVLKNGLVIIGVSAPEVM